MSEKIRAIRQHIFGIAFQFKYHENIEIDSLVNNYLSTLAIFENNLPKVNKEVDTKEDEEVEKYDENSTSETMGTEEISFDFESDVETEINIVDETEPDSNVLEISKDENQVSKEDVFLKHKDDFEGINTFNIDDKSKAYIYRIVSGTYQNLEEIDKYIVKYSKKWSINRLGNEVVTVLRIAIYELLYDKETSHKVVINEAVILAKKYCDDDLYKFVNGLLANVAKEIEEKK